MYKNVSASQNVVEREKETVKFWNENQVFEKTVEDCKGKPNYTFYDGPPTANGTPHIGHVLTRAVKDLIPRYRIMKGYDVPRKAGWDTHGLPVEIEVEKMLGIDGKEQIEAYGLDPFITKCKESVWKYKGMWEDFSKAVGFWADMENPYVTYDNNFIESEWWALKTIYDKGLLYKGYKIVPYCPRCGTPLSSHEVAQGYKTLKERTAVVRFKVVGEDAYFLAWTTTPWTLPSNVALCVNPSDTYVKVKAADGYTYYMAEALLDTVLGKLAEDGKPAYEVLEKYVGTDLEYKEYEPLYKCAADKVAQSGKKAHYVICDDYVTMSDGTGIVHIAPAFGEDDARVGRKYDIPLVKFVDEKGCMTEETPFAGMRCKPSAHEIENGAVSADPEVLKDLYNRGILFDSPKVEHDYPHCWRCNTPLIYYARESWFIKMTAVREDLIRNNNTVNWMPESIGKGRFGDWLENIQDWGISRNRYWGTPLNIWECSCGHLESIGSIEELKTKSDNCPENIELHRPYIDDVTITCPDCGKTMHRVPEVIDCWFDSGSMPFAQHHYPFENKDKFEAQFPADFISEAVDQTRGWFYSLMAISTLLFNKAPYKNVIVLGHVQDADGQKMSKSKGNAVNPMDALNTYGADAIRWYFYSNSALWLPNKWHEKAVMEGQRKFLSTLWNTYAFFVLYANIDNFDATKYNLDECKLTVMDKWLISKLNTVIKTSDEYLNDYKIQDTTRIMTEFVDELSNWYVRRSRERFWAKDMNDDKIAAYMTLYTALVEFSKAAAPLTPFITEEIYQNLVRTNDKNAPESIHLCSYPKYDESKIDPELENNMEEVLTAVTLGRAARNDAAIKNRQPLAKMYIAGEKAIPEIYTDIITDELNVKSLEFTNDASMFVTYTFKPQLRLLGKKLGKRLGAVRTALAELDGSKAKKELDTNGVLKVEVNDGGDPVELTAEELLIDTAKAEGFVSATENNVTVVLDTTLTPELIEEGMVREVVSKVQNMRKSSDFNVTDHISLGVADNDKVAEIIKNNEDSIKSDVLADEITYGTVDGNVEEQDINGEKVKLSVKVVG